MYTRAGINTAGVAEDYTAALFKVKVTVNWGDGNAKDRQVELITLKLSILRHAIQTALRSGLLIACLPTASFALGLGVSITPDTLIVTSSYFTGTTQPIIAGTTQLPGINAVTKVAAVHDSSYPSVFLNAGADASFGITSPI
jgi:hypothetical protein